MPMHGDRCPSVTLGFQSVLESMIGKDQSMKLFCPLLRGAYISVAVSVSVCLCAKYLSFDEFFFLGGGRGGAWTPWTKEQSIRF